MRLSKLENKNNKLYNSIDEFENRLEDLIDFAIEHTAEGYDEYKGELIKLRDEFGKLRR